MRIAFIVNHFYPELGAIRTEFEVARELAKKHNVLVITTFPRKYRLPKDYTYKEPKVRPAILENIETMRVLRVKSFKSRQDSIKQRLAELLTSSFMLTLSSFFYTAFSDLVLVAGDIELVMGQVGLIVGKIWRKPVAVILHDIHPDTLVKSGVIKSKLVLTVSELLIRTFSKYVDLVIVHSNTNARILSKRYSMDQDKMKVVELWANINEVRPATEEKRRKLKAVYVGDPSKKVVSFAGVMNPPQGLDVVIHAARIIKEEYRDYDKIVFLLVGDGMDKPRLQKLASELNVDDIVKFLPLQPRQKYIEILQLSDVCLVTLRRDYIQPVVPSKLLEIMAAGCPAVLSMPPHSDAVKIVEKYKCGIYAGAGDPERLAKAIIQLLENNPLRKELSANARRATEEYYNLSRAVAEYEKLLSELVNKRQRNTKKT